MRQGCQHRQELRLIKKEKEREKMCPWKRREREQDTERVLAGGSAW